MTSQKLDMTSQKLDTDEVAKLVDSTYKVSQHQASVVDGVTGAFNSGRLFGTNW